MTMSSSESGMTPGEVARALTAILADSEQVTAIQILMLGPDAAEVKVQLAHDGSWLQSVTSRHDWGDHSELYQS